MWIRSGLIERRSDLPVVWSWNSIGCNAKRRAGSRFRKYLVCSAITSSNSHALPSGTEIQLIDPVHFVATKLEAFDGRGDNDFVMSHDLEDVVCVLDGRPELEDEVADAAQEIGIYVRRRLRDFMDNPLFIESLPGHLPGDAGSQARLPILIEKLKRLVALVS